MTLDELKRLCEAATPGPWSFTPVYTAGMSGKYSPPNAGIVPEAWDPHGYASPEDAAFIAAARTAMPKLIAVAEAAQACVDSDGRQLLNLHEALSALTSAPGGERE